MIVAAVICSQLEAATLPLVQPNSGWLLHYAVYLEAMWLTAVQYTLMQRNLLCVGSITLRAAACWAASSNFIRVVVVFGCWLSCALFQEDKRLIVLGVRLHA